MAIIYFYVTCFTIYFLLLALQGLRNFRKVRDKYTAKFNNMCVIVYSHNEKEALEQLVKLLKAQDYPASCHSVYVILDNCSDDSEVLLNSELNINVFNIKNMGTVGKSQAYSILVEKLSQVPGLDAFVFLDAKFFVRHDFLTDVNFYLQKHAVLSIGIEPIVTRALSFVEKIRFVYEKYMAGFLEPMRAQMGLSNIINSNAFVMKKSILDKVGYLEIGNIDTELKYTLEISSKGERVFCVPELRVYSDFTNFVHAYSALTTRFELFVDYVKKFDFRRLDHIELISSLIAPNWLSVILLYSLLAVYTFNYQDSLTADFKTVVIQAIVLFVAFFAGIILANIKTKELGYLFMYPGYSLCRLVYNFPIFVWIRALIKKITVPSTVEKMLVDVWVSDGKTNFPCKLEMVSTNGLSSVTFINMNAKKYSTKNNHLRVTDALNELAGKLAEHNLSLKICQCCKYFQPNIDGSTNMVKGFCKCDFADRVPGDILPTLVWNTCERYENQNVVSLFENISKK